MCKFSDWEAKRVYPDIFIAVFNNNFTHIFKSGGVFTPSYPPLAPPLCNTNHLFTMGIVLAS